MRLSARSLPRSEIRTMEVPLRHHWDWRIGLRSTIPRKCFALSCVVVSWDFSVAVLRVRFWFSFCVSAAWWDALYMEDCVYIMRKNVTLVASTYKAPYQNAKHRCEYPTPTACRYISPSYRSPISCAGISIFHPNYLLPSP